MLSSLGASSHSPPRPLKTAMASPTIQQRDHYDRDPSLRDLPVSPLRKETAADRTRALPAALPRFVAPLCPFPCLW